MLKVWVDFLASNWAALLQAPLTSIVMAAIGFVAGTIFLKNQNDALRERLNLREDELKKKDNEIKTLSAENDALRERLNLREDELKKKDNEIKILSAEIEKIREEKQNSIQNLSHLNNDYENYLNELSILELSQEAQKMSRKLERSVQLSEQRQDPSMRSGHIETGLYNEWLSEGSKLLAIKYEALKRLPDDVRLQLDQIPDSRYTSPAFQTNSVMDAVVEIKNIGLGLAEYNASQSNNNLSVQPNKSVGADLQEPLV